MNAGEQKLDLPLSANFHEVKIEHFILDLSCTFDRKVLDGTIWLFCHTAKSIDQTANDVSQTLQDTEGIKIYGHPKAHDDKDCSATENGLPKLLFLDCFALSILSCTFSNIKPDALKLVNLIEKNAADSLQISPTKMLTYYDIYGTLQNADELLIPTNFEVHEHFLKIFIPQLQEIPGQFVIKIVYQTQPQGPSLMWTLDQDNRPCVFTIGHLLNNRSLFPSQDLPQAMSTWHCSVTLLDGETDSLKVLMTGESEPNIAIGSDGTKTFSSYSSYRMPAATFALAFGSWSVTDMLEPSITENAVSRRLPMPRCHLVSPQSLHNKCVEQLGMYLPRCFEVLYNILGTYPLKHLSILIVPECFDSLGLACPHLTFLSQSLLCPDLSMFARLAHELCHTWFGVLTGPRDWTEEWLTEGVCCYLEDQIHAAVMKWDDEESLARTELRSFLKFRLLKSELSNTPEDLQTLRPNAGILFDPGDGKDQVNYVKNGLNPEKTVIQVHYLKGSFLLRHLEQYAGKEAFLETLQRFTSEHLGCLFSSKELLDYFFTNCSKLSCAGLTVAKVCQDWLDCPGMPQPLKDFQWAQDNKLIEEVSAEVSFIKAVASRKRGKGRRPKTHAQSTRTKHGTRKLLPEQIVLLLEMLIEDDVAVTSAQMEELRSSYEIDTANAEIQHSWCELAIRRQALRWTHDIEHFLLHHQALGVYLYGELMISQNRKLQELARDCYRRTEGSMPEGPKATVQAMLFPT